MTATVRNDALEIRDLGAADLPALLELYQQLHASDAPLAPERAAQLWQAIGADPALIYLGGFVAGRLVSACNAVVVLNLTRGGRPYAVIENVVTDAAHRGQGIGGAVLRALVERCWQRDCYKVSLTSAAARGPAHSFYERLGFDRSAKQAFVITRP